MSLIFIAECLFLYFRVAGQMCGGVKREFLNPGKVRLTLSWGFPYEAFGLSGKSELGISIL